MKEELMNKIIQGMLLFLDNAQMGHLLEVLNYALFGYEVKKSDGIEHEDIEQENIKILDAFISAKNIEGCSEKSLKYYRTTIDACNHWKRGFACHNGGFEGVSGELPRREEVKQGND